MRRLMMICAAFAVVVAGTSILFAQSKTKAKPKTKSKSAKTTPTSNSNYIGETEKNPSKAIEKKPEASVFEPNDANTWLKTNPKEDAGTKKPGEKDGKIMDIVDMARQPDAEESTKPKTPVPDESEQTPKNGGKSGAAAGKKPLNLTGGTVIISSKTTKPKRKPTRSTGAKPSTAKRKPQ